MNDQDYLDIQFINSLDPLLSEIDNYISNNNFESSNHNSNNNLLGGAINRLYNVTRDQTFNESNQYSIKHRVIELEIQITI